MRLNNSNAIPQSSARPTNPATTPPAIAPIFLGNFSDAGFAVALGEGLVEVDGVAVVDIVEDEALAAGVGKR
jgi:hypothetical protein